MTDGSFTGKKTFASNIDQDSLKDFLQSSGVPVKQDEREEPFGNEPCTCGSGIRYDLCCGVKK